MADLVLTFYERGSQTPIPVKCVDNGDDTYSFATIDITGEDEHVTLGNNDGAKRVAQFINDLGHEGGGTAPVWTSAPVNLMDLPAPADPTPGRQGILICNESLTDGIRVILKKHTFGGFLEAATSWNERIPPNTAKPFSVSENVKIFVGSESGSVTCPYTYVEFL